MWTKRDWMRMAAVGVGACGLTLASFAALGLTAQEQAAAKPIAVPALKVGSASVSAMVVKNDQVLEVKDAMVTLSANATPSLELRVANQGTQQQTLSFMASMSVQSIADKFSRVARPAAPGWTENFTMTPQAGETKVISAAPGLKVGAGSSGSLVLLGGGARIVALQFTAPAGKLTAAPARR